MAERPINIKHEDFIILLINLNQKICSKNNITKSEIGISLLMSNCLGMQLPLFHRNHYLGEFSNTALIELELGSKFDILGADKVCNGSNLSWNLST